MRVKNALVKGFSTGVYCSKAEHTAALSSDQAHVLNELDAQCACLADLVIEGQGKHALHLDSTGRGVVYVTNLTTTMGDASSVMLSTDAQCVLKDSLLQSNVASEVAVEGDGSLKLSHVTIQGYMATHTTGNVHTPVGYHAEMILDPEAFYSDRGLLLPGLRTFRLNMHSPCCRIDNVEWDKCEELPRTEEQADSKVLLKRRERVKSMFKHAWDSYIRCALGQDELVDDGQAGCRGDDWLGQGITVVDALDTLHLMDLKDDFEVATRWVQDSLVFDAVDSEVSLFESTVRTLGGLLSAYQLSNRSLFLKKAVELGDRLMLAFSENSLLPHTTLNLANGHLSDTSKFAALSEICGIQLEFTQLSRSSCDLKYERAAISTLEHVLGLKTPQEGYYAGLKPIFLSMSDGSFVKGARLSMGAGGDSFYEYLLKLSILKQHNNYDSEYAAAVDAMSEHLLWHSASTNRVYVTDSTSGRPSHRFEMLSCFLPGMLAISSQKRKQWSHHLQIAKHLMMSCVALFDSQPHGLAPETVMFSAETGDFKAEEKRHLLRPETFESLYMLHQVTGDDQYREHAWRLLENLDNSCKRKNGYSGVDDVTAPDLRPDGRQHSYFLAETAKYLFLLFSERHASTVNTSTHVFSTEAHPFSIAQSTKCRSADEL